jgi:3-phenylpropionate/trans-cinnamate dioxygenase ferredoxin reductase subunit
MSGGNAAVTLREQGYPGPVVMIGDEQGLPFGRPPLSKGYLRGEVGVSGWLVRPAGWYEQNSIERVGGVVTRIDTTERRVELDTGDVRRYAKLLIATGGRNRRPSMPGADLSGVHQLRTVADCDGLKRAAVTGARALVVGMGFIGCEVAASIRQLGVDVTAVFPGSAPLESVLGPEMGEVFTGIHEDAGVRLVPHDSVAHFEGAGRVERAVTASGRRIDCDLAIVAVGIQPNVEVLQDSGIAVENGVLVDATCQTNVPDVFAAGDVANQLHPLFGRIRVEHYNNAEKQGAAAAKSMLGSNAEFGYVHTFWSDQYEHKLEYVGHVRRWGEFVVRGSLKARRFVGFYLSDGVLRAAVGFDRGDDPELDLDGEMARAGRLIARQARPSIAALVDEGEELAPG